MNLNEQIISFLSQPLVLTAFFGWTIFWKGRALWKSARNKHLTWFVILMVVNTVGLLEIAYIFYFDRWDMGSSKLLAFFEKKFKPRKKI